MAECEYNQIIDNKNNTLFIKLIKNLNIQEINVALKDSQLNPFILNIYGQNSIDFINKMPYPLKDEILNKILKRNSFKNINFSENDKKLIKFDNNIELHKFLKLKNKNIIKALYKKTICLKRNIIINPFLINKLIFIKKHFPSIKDSILLKVINHKNSSFDFYFINNYEDKIFPFLDFYSLIKIINKINSQRNLLLFEDSIKIMRENKINFIFENIKINTPRDLRSFLMMNIIIDKYKIIPHLNTFKDLNNTFIYDNYQIIIPYSVKDFLEISYKMNNCLTDLDFFESHIKNKQFIFFIKNLNTYYCIELNTDFKLKVVLKKFNLTPIEEEKIIINNIINLIF